MIFNINSTRGHTGSRASKLKDHEIGRSPYFYETKSGDFYGNFSRCFIKGTLS